MSTDMSLQVASLSELADTSLEWAMQEAFVIPLY